jgi:hypothetical protein
MRGTRIGSPLQTVTVVWIYELQRNLSSPTSPEARSAVQILLRSAPLLYMEIHTITAAVWLVLANIRKSLRLRAAREISADKRGSSSCAQAGPAREILSITTAQDRDTHQQDRDRDYPCLHSFLLPRYCLFPLIWMKSWHIGVLNRSWHISHLHKHCTGLPSKGTDS